MSDSWHTLPMNDAGGNPCVIPDNDPLLAKLFEVYGAERRYEELDLKRGEKK